MARSVWWALAVAALAFTVWNATSLTMLDVSMSCSKIAEANSYQCGDRAIDVLGVWPLLGVGLLLATPPAAAAIAMRKSVSWLAVIALLGLFVAGLLSVTSDSSSLFPRPPSERSPHRSNRLSHDGEHRRSSRRIGLRTVRTHPLHWNHRPVGGTEERKLMRHSVYRGLPVTLHIKLVVLLAGCAPTTTLQPVTSPRSLEKATPLHARSPRVRRARQRPRGERSPRRRLLMPWSRAASS
jgi:hypothetical protein